jgi:methyl-accepting chemotaxis protein
VKEAMEGHEKAEAGKRAIIEAAGAVERIVDNLTSTAKGLSVQVEQSHRAAETEQLKVSAALNSMQEMSNTIMDVARNANAVSEHSAVSRDKAQEGAGIVERSIAALTTVQSDMSALNGHMDFLTQHAAAVGSVITVISDIADQTNLLALNAAIEAARAGEAGRGFAVVADEVRKLAEKTMIATKEVNDTIHAIQAGTGESSLAAVKVNDNVTKAAILAQESGNSLDGIVNVAAETASQIHAIAAAAEEQSAACAEISKALDAINTSAMETSSAMRQAAQAVTELSGQTDQLQVLVRQLRAEG